VTPPAASHAPIRKATPPSPQPLSPPPSTQARLTHPKLERAVATRHGKRPTPGPSLVKKTAVDRFNDSRQEESRRLNLKRKMEHDEKMASIRLKKHKYDLRYGSGSTPQTPLPVAGSSTAAVTKEDKQIEILRLQIRLAELTRDNSAYASSSRSRAAEGVSTPSSGISGISSLSYPGHNGFVDNNDFMTSEDRGEVSNVGADIGGWPDTYNFS
jgi:hypothetical protein